MHTMRTAHLELKVKLVSAPKDRALHMELVVLAQSHPAKSHGSWDRIRGTESQDAPHSRFLNQDCIINHLLLFFFHRMGCR